MHGASSIPLDDMTFVPGFDMHAEDFGDEPQIWISYYSETTSYGDMSLDDRGYKMTTLTNCWSGESLEQRSANADGRLQGAEVIPPNARLVMDAVPLNRISRRSPPMLLPFAPSLLSFAPLVDNFLFFFAPC